MSLETKTSLSGWHPEDVKAAIRKRGKTLSDLSRDHQFSEAYLRNALCRPLFEAEQIIARFLGVPAQEIWPDRYNTDGEADYRPWSAARRAKFVQLQRAASRRNRAA